MGIHQSNRACYDKIRALIDDQGRPAIRGHLLNLIKDIARYPRENGCFKRDSLLNHDSGNDLDRKTHRLCMRYLEHIGVVSIRDNGRRKVRRLEAPTKSRVKSQRDFRHEIRVASYAYMDTKNPVFLSKKRGKLDDHRGKLPHEGWGNLPHTITRSNVNWNERERKTSVVSFTSKPGVPAVIAGSTVRADLAAPAKRAPQAGPMARPLGEGYRPRPNDETHSFTTTMTTTNDEAGRGDHMGKASGKRGNVHAPHEKPCEGDPGLVRGKKRPATRREARAEAARAYKRGHVVNPLGGKTRGRQLSPARACKIDLDDDSSVTVAQLYRFMGDLYDERYGDASLIYADVPTDRRGFSAAIDNLRQKFIDSCMTSPSNRDLARYMDWATSPGNARRLWAGTKRSFPNWYQLQGTVHVRRFYDERMLRSHLGKDRGGIVSERLERSMRVTDAVRRAFDEIKAAGDDEGELVGTLVKHGYVIFSEYLNDTLGMDGPHCMERMIELMAGFLRGSRDHVVAMEYLAYAATAAEANFAVKSDLWPDWRVACKDIVDKAARRAGVKVGNVGSSG